MRTKPASTPASIWYCRLVSIFTPRVGCAMIGNAYVLVPPPFSRFQCIVLVASKLKENMLLMQYIEGRAFGYVNPYLKEE
jgi:hypothetical protein